MGCFSVGKIRERKCHNIFLREVFFLSILVGKNNLGPSWYVCISSLGSGGGGVGRGGIEEKVSPLKELIEV